MDELIIKQAATTIPVMPKEHRHYQTNNLDDAYEQGWADLQECIENLPSVQPKGTKLSTVCLLCKKPAVTFNTEDDIPYTNYSYCEDCLRKGLKLLKKQIKALPPVHPKIIHCKDCKHWNLQVGNVKGDGLGSCDFHNVNLVTGEGFCFWAKKRGDSE